MPLLLIAAGFLARNALRAALWGAAVAGLGVGVKLAGEGAEDIGAGVKDLAIGAALGLGVFMVAKRIK